MPTLDMSLDDLMEYCPQRDEPRDFDAFWSNTLKGSRQDRIDMECVAVDSGMRMVDVYDVSFAGYAGDRIKAWLTLPAGITQRVPCVVEFPGYGWGRGLPQDVLFYAAAGYAHLMMDIRGQGSAVRPGDTPDREPDGAGGPHFPGFMTRGILDPNTYYYRRVIIDAVRAVDAIRTHRLVDADRVAVGGRSQGGGLSLMVAGLLSGIAAAMPDVPFLCHYRRAVQVATLGPYPEIEGYLKIHRDQVDQVFATLSYFDGLNFATRATAPALFSVGLLDPICPPSTVYGALHHYRGPKEIEVYRFNGHEGGETFQAVARLRFLRDIFS